MYYLSLLSDEKPFQNLICVINSGHISRPYLLLNSRNPLKYNIIYNCDKWNNKWIKAVYVIVYTVDINTTDTHIYGRKDACIRGKGLSVKVLDNIAW